MKSILMVCAVLVLTGIPLHAQARPPRVLLLHDMEGLAGEDDWRMYLHMYPDLYVKGQRLLVADVNAVVAGLFDAGAAKLDVIDAHGSGNTEPDIPLELLDPRAKMVFRDKPYHPYVGEVAPNTYEAVVLVGGHAKPGSNGFASHAFTLGAATSFNGRVITEAEFLGYSWGRVGVPVIFVSGDDRLKNDLAQPMPWIEFAVTKHAVNSTTVQLLPVDQVHADMRAAAKRALQNLGRMQVMKLSGPIEVSVRASQGGDLSLLEGIPGVRYQDNSVSFSAPDFQAAFDGLVPLWRMAVVMDQRTILLEMMRNQPNGPQLQFQLNETMFTHWLDYEAGRWKPTPPTPPVQKRYFGAN